MSSLVKGSRFVFRLLLSMMAGFVACSIAYMGYDLTLSLGEIKVATPEKVVGQMRMPIHDVKLKTASSMDWGQARKSRRLHANDVVAAGAGSQAWLRWDHGPDLTIEENSVLQFAEFEGVQLPDLREGSFRLYVDGPMRLALRGTVTQLTGKGEVIATLEPQGPALIRSVTGSVHVANAYQEQTYNVNAETRERKPASLETPAPLQLVLYAPIGSAGPTNDFQN